MPSQRSKPPVTEKKVEKVIKGTVKTKKKTGITKFTDVFIAKDVRDVKTFMVGDVLIPAIKNTLEDIIVKGARMLLRGESGSRGGSRKSYDRVSYRDYYDRDDYRNDDIPFRSTSRSYEDISLESRDDAEEVLKEMNLLIKRYGMVSIGDLNDLVGRTGEYTDNKYGWTNLRNAYSVRERDGYSLKLPRPKPLD